MKRTRRRKAEMEEDSIHLHRFCVSADWMRRSYRNSSDYQLCDKDGTSNPVGDYVQSVRTGKIKEVGGQCDLQLLADGSPNPDWKGCPRDKNYVMPPPTFDSVNKYLDPDWTDEIKKLEALLESMK